MIHNKELSYTGGFSDVSDEIKYFYQIKLISLGF